MLHDMPTATRLSARTSINLSPADMERVVDLAEQEATSVGTILRRAVRQFLQAEEREQA